MKEGRLSDFPWRLEACPLQACLVCGSRNTRLVFAMFPNSRCQEPVPCPLRPRCQSRLTQFAKLLLRGILNLPRPAPVRSICSATRRHVLSFARKHYPRIIREGRRDRGYDFGSYSRICTERPLTGKVAHWESLYNNVPDECICTRGWIICGILS